MEDERYFSQLSLASYISHLKSKIYVFDRK
jgi:hypothetical protein